MTSVVIADDERIVRAGLRTILESAGDIDVVAEAGDGGAALDETRRHDPDVVLMDIQMPHLDGIAATRELAASGSRSRVLVLTTYGMDENLYAALRAGAAGFVTKSLAPDRLIAAVHAVAAGETVLGPDVIRQLVDHVRLAPPAPDRPPSLDALTPRELEVLRLMAAGLSNAEIAERLYVGEGTVKTHVSRVLTKLGLRDRVQAVVFAFEHGVAHTAGP